MAQRSRRQAGPLATESTFHDQVVINRKNSAPGSIGIVSGDAPDKVSTQQHEAVARNK